MICMHRYSLKTLKDFKIWLITSHLLPTGLIELKQESRHLEVQVQYRMSQLTTQVKRRDKLRHRRERQYNLITAILQASSQKRSKIIFILSFTGQLNSEWIYEVIISPKMQTKNYKDICPTIQTRIVALFLMIFWRV